MKRNTGQFEGLVTFMTPRPHSAPTEESVDVLAETLEKQAAQSGEPAHVAATTQKEILVTLEPAPGEASQSSSTLIPPPRVSPLQRTFMHRIRPFEEAEQRREKQRVARRRQLGELAIAVRQFIGVQAPDRDAVSEVGAALDSALRTSMADIIDELGELGMIMFKPLAVPEYRNAVELTDPIDIIFNGKPAFLNVVYTAPESLPMFIVQTQITLPTGQDTIALSAGGTKTAQTLSLSLYNANRDPDLVVRYIEDESHSEIDPKRMQRMSKVTFKIAQQLTELINAVE